jgi:hypothetical protein
MEEVTNQGLTPEIAQQEIAAPETDIQQESTPKETVNDRNWKELNRSKEEWKRKAQAQEEITRQVLAMHQAPKPNEQQPESDLSALISAIQKEEYVPGASVAKGLEAMAKTVDQKLKRLEDAHKQQKRIDSLSDLRRRKPDLDEVVNPETLTLLAQQDPELAAQWQNLDDYAIAVQAYPVIKAMGILDQVPGERRAKEVDKKLDQNKKTVQSPQVFSTRPMAQAFREPQTKAEKEALWQETLKYASQAGMGY